MSYRFDYVIFVGRFQPFHHGHQFIVDHALSQGEKLLLLIGSCSKPRTIKDPWTYAERVDMIRSSLPNYSARIAYGALYDTLYNDEQWVRSVQEEVARLIRQDGKEPLQCKIALIGHDKDLSSYYLRMFPQWARLALPNHEGLSATMIRHAWLNDEEGDSEKLINNVPSAVSNCLAAFKATPVYKTLVDEFHFIRRYKASWEKAPYPPTFVTVDAILVHSGHVLMIRRRAEPGKGLWAWPGGFVNQNETLLEACLRELREETRLKIPAPVLKGSIKGQHVFDHPDRSMRGRTITHAFFFEFPSGELPEIRGADDADKAVWMPLSDFFEMRASLFEDHFDMGVYFLGTV